MKVVLADPAGACYGVERALALAREAALRPGNPHVSTLGPLIHNPIVVRDLESAGVSVAGSVDEADDGVLVIRSHGVTREVLAEASAAEGLEVVDATCPHVARVQREAQAMAADGRYVIVVGEPGHPEVEGIASYAGERSAVVERAVDLPDLPSDTRVGVVVQTTQSPALLREVEEALRERISDVRVADTICSATARRQQAAAEVAGSCDAMIVIGGRNSGNTRRLFELCAGLCPNSHHIESPDEMDPGWFIGCETVGITAGASTPRSQIESVMAVLGGL